MDVKQIFIDTNNALNRVVQQIEDNQWDQLVPDTPEWKAGTSEPMTLRAAVNYIAYDNSWVPDMMAGQTMDEAGRDKYDGDLLGDSPSDRFTDITARANAAVEDLQDLDRQIHFAYGSYPAHEALKHITSYRGIRIYDISKMIGVDAALPEDVVQGLWDEIEPDIDQWRAMGVFPAGIDISDRAPLQDRLFAMVGRAPRS